MDASVIDWFKYGGPPMFGILALDSLFCTLIPVALLLAMIGKVGGLRLAARIVSFGVLLGALLPAVVGALGWWSGRSKVDQAIAFVDPDQIDALRRVGYEEAFIPMQFGAGSALLLVLFAAIPLSVSLARGAPPSEPT